MLSSSHAALVLAVTAMASGCGVKVSTGGAVDAATEDALATDGSIDARALDAAPAPCIEGEARMTTASGCFAVFTAITLVRVDARAACATHGMHLAYVKSAADEAVIAALANGKDVAVGADDLAVEGTFVWEDGSPVVYTDWHTGEPNNGAGMYEEDCVIYAGSRVGGGWDDRPCAPPPAASGSYGYVCQRAP